MSVRRHLVESPRQQEDNDFRQGFLRRFFDLPAAADSPQQRRRRSSSSNHQQQHQESSIIDDLNNNRDDFGGELKQLKLSSVHALLDCHQLCQAIANNRSVRTVRIHGFFVEKLPTVYQERLWQAIVKLPNLEELHLNYFLEAPLTTKVLAFVVSQAKRLVKLSIHDTRLMLDSNDDSNGLLPHTICLQNHIALKKIAISQLSLMEKIQTLDPLVRSFASAPNLQSLSLRMTQKQNNLLSNSTLNLLSKKQLKSLELRKIMLGREHITHLTMSLCQHEKGEMLSVSLCELILECDKVLDQTSCEAVGEMLQHNQTLERLELWGTMIDEKGMVSIADKLKQNRKLKVLRLSFANISTKAQERLVDVIQHHNYFLETLSLSTFSNVELLIKSEFFLQLNATCLRRLMLNINASPEQIFDKIVYHADNLDYLFHILKGNPSFLPLQHSKH